VLTGVITALLCQGLAPFEATRLGVYLHGLAGNLAAEKLGQVSLIASDLIDYLPAAFQTLSSSANNATS
jgi:NAD(P)H-hydrate repair Nnr-like enzyme with NAD(P)H-hydrate dehydratase domain